MMGHLQVNGIGRQTGEKFCRKPVVTEDGFGVRCYSKVQHSVEPQRVKAVKLFSLAIHEANRIANLIWKRQVGGAGDSKVKATNSMYGAR